MSRQQSKIFSRADNGQKTFNIAMAMADKLGINLAEGFNNQEDVVMPLDVQKIAQSELDGVGSQAEVARTVNPSRPRAYAIGYSMETATLYVIFRKNVWWEYRNVPVSVWAGLKGASSVGRYLLESGLDSWTDMGPADIEEIPQGLKARLSQMAAIAGNIQGVQ